MGNPVVRFEIGAADDQPLVRFYGELFGWDLQAVAEGYTLVDTRGGRGINGGIGAGGEARWVTVYAAVEDVEATLARAGSLGGTRVYGPNPVDDHTDTGVFRDPAGNLFGVYRHGPH
jgi:uncharacterized protein